MKKTEYIKRGLIASVIASLVIFSTGCSSKPIENTSTAEEEYTVIATLFPEYDFARIIAGDKANVSLLLPPGVEAHAYEPTPRDIVSIEQADMFIYTGEQMEPWAHKVIETIGDEKIESGELMVIESGEGLFDVLLDEDHDSEEDHDGDDDDHGPGGVDPHIWLDPLKAIDMVTKIEEGFVSASPENEAYFRNNAKSLKDDLKELDEAFVQTFAKTQSNTIISGGHFAFGHFIKRYNLEYQSPYVGFAPDAEPTPKRIAELIEYVNASQVKAIYFEELVNPKVAKIISDETDAQMLMLHAGHNVSKEDIESGISYLDIMYGNLENLKIGLGYNN